jgi:uncharacterized tellurite resistance protein B-like protein
MHIVIAFLSALVTVFYLLDRLGIDLGGFNPFHWRRKRTWNEAYHADPIYSIEDPMHVAAILILGGAKLDGDISAEQKKVASALFESQFSLDPKGASELLGSAAHLLGAPQVIDAQLDGVVKNSQDRFSKDQAESMMQMMVQVVSADGEMTTAQSDFVENVRSRLVPAQKGEGTWAQ